MNRTHESEDLKYLDELLEARIRVLSEMLDRSHSLAELETETNILYELVQSFKFRNDYLRKLIDNERPTRLEITEALGKQTSLVLQNRERLAELTLQSRRLLQKSERLFAKLGIEKTLLNSSLRQHRNLLLAAVPPAEYGQLIPKLERVLVTMGKTIYHADEPIQYVYFPETAVFTILATLSNGASVEVGMVGNDAMLGVRVLFGSVVSSTQAIVLVRGTALRMKVAELQAELRTRRVLQKLLLRYSQVALSHVRQDAACKNFHSVERRVARYLPTMNSYVKPDEVILTQSQIAQMIGSRLAGVSEAAGKLQREDLIKYSRGHIQIIDERALSEIACECYGVMQTEREQLVKSYSQIE